MLNMIYFDNGATSFIKPECVKKAVKNALNNYTGNAGRSSHEIAKMTALQVFDTREILKKFLSAKNYDVIFTKNCSEALNLAILGSAKRGGHIITTTLEHNSVLRTVKYLENNFDVEVTFIDPKSSAVSAKEIFQKFKPNTYMVIVNHISNVTGAMCDIYEIGQLKKIKNFLYLVDGAQSFGHTKIDLTKANVDFFTLAGHKGGLSITGVGALIVKNVSGLQPINYGGTGTDSINLIQPHNFSEDFEVGTLPIIPIISLKAGVEYLIKNFDEIQKKEESLDKMFIEGFKNLPKIITYFDEQNVHGVFSFNLNGFSSEVIADYLNNYSICVRSGLHCAPLVHKRLKTTKIGAVRISVNFFNTLDEVKEFFAVLISLIDNLK